MTDAEGEASLSATLEDLFRTVLKDPAGVEYTLRDVETWCDAAGYGSIRPETVRRLRKGYQTNPTTNTLAALGAFFGVPASSLADETSRAHLRQQLAALRADVARGAKAAPLSERLAQQQMLARRAGSLSSSQQDMLFEFLEVMNRKDSEASGDEGH